MHLLNGRQECSYSASKLNVIVSLYTDFRGKNFFNLGPVKNMFFAKNLAWNIYKFMVV